MGLLRVVPVAVAVPVLVACGAGTGPTLARPAAVQVSPKAMAKPAPAVDVAEPDEPTAAAPVVEVPEPVDPAILEVVGRHWRVDGWTLVPLMEIDASDRALVIVWPAFDPEGKLTRRKDLVGFVVGRGPPRERQLILGAPFDATALTPEEVDERLGTASWQMRDRGEGVELVAIGERLAALPALFEEAVKRGDREEAVDLALHLNRLYAPWALQDNVGETLLLVTRGGLRMEHIATDGPEGPANDRATVRLRLTTLGEPPAEAALEVRRLPEGPGWAIAGSP